MIRIVIADDDAIIREGLKMIIETQADMELIGVAVDGTEAVKLCESLTPDVTVLDIRMPNMDGIEAATILLRNNLTAPLLLTTFDEPDFILRALKAGVNGYILKNSPAQRILSAIRAIHTGGTVFQADVLEFIRQRVMNQNTVANLYEAILTPRELEIVKLIAEGLSNKNIGDTLFLSNGTVRNHISTILEKTGLEHRTQLAIHYLKNNK